MASFNPELSDSPDRSGNCPRAGTHDRLWVLGWIFADVVQNLYSMPSRSSRRSSARQWRRTRTDSSRCTCGLSSRSIDRRAATPIALIMRPPDADQDPLLGLGLGQHDGFDPDQVGARLDDLEDLDLDRVGHLLARAGQDLLADQLGQQHGLGLV